ncbi:MAG: helix-turn-helix domain-containing protein [Thermotogota bacterium]
MVKLFLDNDLIGEMEQYLSRFKKKCLISSHEADSKYSEPWDIVVLSEKSFDKSTSIEMLQKEFPFCRLFFLPSSVYSPKIHREDVIVFSDKNTLINNLITVLSIQITMDEKERRFSTYSVCREPLFSGNEIKPFLMNLRGKRSNPLNLLFVEESGTESYHFARFLYPELIIDIVDCSQLSSESLRLYMEGDSFKSGFLSIPHQCVFFDAIHKLDTEDLLYLYSTTNRSNGVPLIASCRADELERVKTVFDLYERVEIPPIRKRKDDIPFLINDLISRFAQEHNLKVIYPTKSALDICRMYSWPGNYTELKNFTRDYCLNGPLKTLQEFFKGIKQIKTDDQLPELSSFQKKLRHTVEEIFVKKVMEITDNNRKKAASLLGISYKSLSKKLKLYE